MSCSEFELVTNTPLFQPGSHGPEAFPSDSTQRSLTHEELLSQVSARLQGRGATSEAAPKSSKRSSSSGGQSTEPAHVQEGKPQPKGLPLPRERYVHFTVISTMNHSSVDDDNNTHHYHISIL